MMGPFEISLIIIKTAQEFFLYVAKIKQHCQMFDSLFIDLFGNLFDMFSVQDFEAVPKIFMSMRKMIVYFFVLWHFYLTATRDSRLVFVFFGMDELSSLSPPHRAYISAL